MGVVLGEIGSQIDERQTILSVAAGITTSFVESHLPPGARVAARIGNVVSFRRQTTTAPISTGLPTASLTLSGPASSVSSRREILVFALNGLTHQSPGLCSVPT